MRKIECLEQALSVAKQRSDAQLREIQVINTWINIDISLCIDSNIIFIVRSISKELRLRYDEKVPSIDRTHVRSYCLFVILFD
jgi:hypothetical protein